MDWSRQYTDKGAHFRFPCERRFALHRAVEATGQRQDRNENVPVRDHEIVNHAGVRRIEAIQPRHLADLVDNAEGHILSEELFARHVTEEQHLAGFRIDLGVGGEAVGIARVREIALRSKRACIDFKRLMTFFERKQLARVIENVGVGDAGVFSDHRRIACHRIAEGAEHRLACRVFQFPFRRADPAVAVAHFAVLNVEGMQHPVARKPMIVLVARIELRVGAGAIEAARQFARHLAFHGQIGEIVFAADGGKIASEKRIDASGRVHDHPPLRIV